MQLLQIKVKSTLLNIDRTKILTVVNSK